MRRKKKKPKQQKPKLPQPATDSLRAQDPAEIRSLLKTDEYMDVEGYIKSPEDVEFLLTFLSDRDQLANATVFGALSLAANGDVDLGVMIKPAFEALLNDEEYVAYSAASALGGCAAEYLLLNGNPRPTHKQEVLLGIKEILNSERFLQEAEKNTPWYCKMIERLDQIFKTMTEMEEINTGFSTADLDQAEVQQLIESIKKERGEAK